MGKSLFFVIVCAFIFNFCFNAMLVFGLVAIVCIPAILGDAVCAAGAIFTMVDVI